MKQKMNFGRRGLALFVSLLMCLSFLPGRASAASNFNITYRVYNETTGASRVIATDNSVSRPDSGYIQVSFQVPYLSSLTSDNYGRVTKVTSNAYFSGGSTGSGNEGASCNLSRNNPNITFTYWVTGWPSAAQDPNAGTGSGSSDNVSIGSGSGRYYINATLVYHSNYPNGKDITKSYTYSGQNFTAIYNIFTLKSYDNDLGFSYAGYSYTGWYSDKNCSSSIGNIGLENGNTYHVYAGWESNTPEPDPIEPVTLIYMDRGSRYEQQTHFEGDVPTAIDCVNTNSGYRFSGWDTDSSADSVVYEVGDGVSLSGEVTTLYAVWECAHDHDGNGYCTDPNCDHDDTCCPKPGHKHEDDDHDGKCDDPDCGECLHDHDSDGTCTDPDCTHDDECCPKKQVTVTFDTNSGRWDRGDMDTPTSHSMTLRLGAAVGARVFPVNPVRADYIFAGWNTDKDGKGDAFAADTPVMSDITVYAQWTALPTEVPAPSLKTSKTILNLSNEVDSGAPVVYQVIVMNNGNCDLENVSVLDTLPEGLTFDRFVDGLGTTDRLTNIAKNQGQNRGQLIAWRVGELAKGESLVFTYRAIAENEGDEQITLTNDVQARGDAKGTQSTGRSMLLSAGDDFWDWINDSQNNGTVGDGSSADIIVNPNPDPDPNPDPNPNPNPDPNPDPNPNPNPDPDPDPNPDPNPNPNPDPDPTPGGDDPYIPDDPTPTTPAPADPGTEIADEETPLAGAIGLNSDDHFAYIVGYEDNTVRPLNEISRAEVATIFFRLMTEEYRQLNWATTNSFSDVKEGDWYNNAISTCAKAGLLAGYEDGTFRPDDPITRAEFATIAARFLEETVDGSAVGDFTDTVGHWASADIRRAVVAGWISGDGSTFRPDENIIRADVMVIVNKMLDRTPDAEHFLPDMIKWSDNPEGTWYYEAVQEATNQHNYERDEENVETWTELTEAPKWAELEKQWADNNGASAQLSWRMPDGI